MTIDKAESDRLRTLHALEILDTPPDESFDRLTRLATQILEVPICLVSLIDEHRQWFKSRQGLEVKETPRDIAFCTYAIQTDAPFIIADALEDSRFRDNPLVTGDPNIRSYAGIPLAMAGDWNVGTLCAIDTKPRQFSDAQIAALHDISRMVVELLELRVLSRSLRESEKRFRDVTDKIPDAIFRYFLHPDGSDTIEFMSDACVDLWEYTSEELNKDPTPIWEMIHPEDIMAMRESVEGSAANLSPWSHRWRISTPSGTLKWVHGRGTPRRMRDGTVFWNSVVTDISETVRRERELSKTVSDLNSAKLAAEYQAFHDSLTGLPNRRFLDRELKSIRLRRSTDQTAHQMLHVDIDRFKEINDTLGHAVGDKIITYVARKLQESVRASDTVIRVGGDEFIVLCPDCEDDHAIDKVASKILTLTQRPVVLGEQTVRLSVSIGIGRACSGGTESLLTDSDIALYEAKRAGRNRFVRFTRSMRTNLEQRKHLADDITRGLEASEFVPVFQPQFDIATSQLIGLEALARWQHPSRGLLAPGSFLSAAEDLGLDKQIDATIFRKSMKLASYFAGIGVRIPKISVNVSLSRLLDETLGEEIRQFKPASLRVALELVETVHFDDKDNGVFEAVKRLRDQDVQIEIDDFGSGRASITALQRIQPETLKIDRVLIAPVTESASALDLIRSIVEIGRCLGIGVTAEGVETLEQLTALNSVGVNAAQGFYLARPMTAEHLVRFMKSHACEADRLLKAG